MLDESLMITGDRNIAEIHFRIYYNIKNVRDFTFNVREPDNAVRAVAESAMREVIDSGEVVLSRFDDALNLVPSGGLAYLPTASYREMEGWSLPAPAALRFLARDSRSDFTLFELARRPADRRRADERPGHHRRHPRGDDRRVLGGPPGDRRAPARRAAG